MPRYLVTICEISWGPSAVTRMPLIKETAIAPGFVRPIIRLHVARTNWWGMQKTRTSASAMADSRSASVCFYCVFFGGGDWFGFWCERARKKKERARRVSLSVLLSPLVVKKKQNQTKTKTRLTRHHVRPEIHPGQVLGILVRRVDRVAQLLAVVHPHLDLVREAVGGVAPARRV